MAFESLSEKLNGVFKKLRGKGRLSEKDVKEALREVRLALLESDVNYKIVKDFIARLTERAVGEEVLKSLTPGQHVVKIVNEELTKLMGGSESKLKFSQTPPTVFMAAGLQGAGKTTAVGKLASLLKKQNKRPLLAACDVYRPAAVKQLEIEGKKHGAPVFSLPGADPVAISKEAVEFAKKNKNDVVIIDTAGRLHIDEELMTELKNIKAAVSPDEILLVVDAMTGQDAVNVAQSFNEALEIDGIIITKLDGDARGGAALSVAQVTGKPVKFVGTGEKAEDLEVFHPARMASRILGMGDILSLAEKAQQALDEEQARALEKKMRVGDFNLEDFLEQMQQIKKMGPIQNLLGMLPGMNSLPAGVDLSQSETALKSAEAIIYSMTPKERQNPGIINGSRKKRIAGGCGRTIPEINRLLKQFEEMKKMMKQFQGMSKRKGFPFKI